MVDEWKVDGVSATYGKKISAKRRAVDDGEKKNQRVVWEGTGCVGQKGKKRKKGEYPAP